MRVNVYSPDRLGPDLKDLQEVLRRSGTSLSPRPLPAVSALIQQHRQSILAVRSAPQPPRTNPA